MGHLSKNAVKLTARVRRIGGQITALERALTNNVECGAVLQQLAAVRGAVNGLMLEVLASHLREHVAPKRRRPGDDSELQPVIAVLRRYLK